jgi:outer membrane protein OmpA-like peptidoglycan-associated protein
MPAPDWVGTYNWTGPYVGLQGGYGWGDSTGGLAVSGFPIPYHPHPDGVIGGAHAGYDWQMGHLVIGGVADVDGADLQGDSIRTHAQYQVKTLNNLDASLRGKVGLAFSRVQLYGTGGLAVGDVKSEYSCPTCYRAPGPYDTLKNVRVGWTAGAGAEVALAAKWSADVEYRYTDLGSKAFTDLVTTAQDTGNNFTFSAVTVGVSYRFLPPRMPAPEPAPIVPAMAPVPMPMAPAPPPHNRAYLVFFDFDRYDLTPEAGAVVQQAARSFRESGFARIEVSGYTDLSGSQEYNMRLSQRRATTVAELLAHLGVPRPAMNVVWHGKENPRVPTADGVRAPQNRRVEIVMP